MDGASEERGSKEVIKIREKAVPFLLLQLQKPRSNSGHRLLLLAPWRDFQRSSRSLFRLRLPGSLHALCTGRIILSRLEMLAVFHKSVAMAPQELSSPSTRPDSRSSSGLELLHYFVSKEPRVLHFSFQDIAHMAYTHHNQALLRPRSFAVVDDICCLFEGNLMNLPTLRHEYGLAKTVSEVILVIEAYKALRDRGPYPADQVVSALEGQFVFILFDITNKNAFVAVDGDAKIPLYWGTIGDGSLAFSDNAEVLKMGCGLSFAPFPPGCFFLSQKGLQSFEHPLQKLKPVPRIDEEGQALGATFKVDMNAKDDEQSNLMQRVESEANWAASI